MKNNTMRLAFFILIMIIMSPLMAQERDSTIEIIDPIEYYGEFPGGADSMWCFIENMFNYEILNSKNLHGKVIASFIVEDTGAISNIETNSKYTSRFSWYIKDEAIENEIRRVIAMMPKWKPALQMGKKVRMSFNLPINIPYTKFKCPNTHIKR